MTDTHPDLAAIERFLRDEASADSPAACGLLLAEWPSVRAELERLTAAVGRVESLIGDCNGHRHLSLDITRCPWCMVRAALTPDAD